MARVQRIESDSSFNNANVLNGTILTYKTLQNGSIVHKAKLPNGNVVEISPRLSIVKLGTPQQGFAATYQLQDSAGTVLGANINIIQDSLLRSIQVIQSATIEDKAIEPTIVIGDPYLKLTFYVQKTQQGQDTSIAYVPLKYLKDVYTAGKGIVLTNGQFSINSDSASDTARYLTIGDSYIGLKNISTDIDRTLQEAKNYTDKRVSVLSDSIELLLKNYYTSEEVNKFIASISDSISSLWRHFDNYYDKDKIELLLAELSNSISWSNYYTKAQIDRIINDLPEPNVFPQGGLPGQYLRKGSNSLFWDDISTIIGSNSIDLSNYYTKQQIDYLLQNLSPQGAYYIEVTQITDNNIHVPQFKIPVGIQTNNNHYYPVQKQSVLLSSDSITISIAPYLAYQGTEIFTPPWKVWFLGGSGEGSEADLSNYYTKDQVDELIKTHGYCTQISDAQQGWIYIDQLKVPAGIQTNTGKYYPIQKQSVLLGSDSVTIDIKPYLAYQGTEIFTPPWKVWFLGGSGEGSEADLSNYYTKDQTNGKLTQLSQQLMFYIIL